MLACTPSQMLPDRLTGKTQTSLHKSSVTHVITTQFALFYNSYIHKMSLHLRKTFTLHNKNGLEMKFTISQSQYSYKHVYHDDTIFTADATQQTIHTHKQTQTRVIITKKTDIKHSTQTTLHKQLSRPWHSRLQSHVRSLRPPRPLMALAAAGSPGSRRRDGGRGSRRSRERSWLCQRQPCPPPRPCR